jgi:hypothetical protein
VAMAGGDLGSGEVEEIERQRAGPGVEKSPSLGLGQGKDFFKNVSWAHWTVNSGCPVHTGQRTVTVRCPTGHGRTVAMPRAPSRCIGHCTVQCSVHTRLSGEPRQRVDLNFSRDFEPNQIPTYKPTKEHLLGQVLEPSHILLYFSKYCAIGYIFFR